MLEKKKKAKTTNNKTTKKYSQVLEAKPMMKGRDRWVKALEETGTSLIPVKWMKAAMTDLH